MKYLKLIGIFLAASMVFSAADTVSFAKERKKKKEELSIEDYDISTDPTLAKGRKALEKAIMYMNRGHKEFRGRPGLAQKNFEHAQSYFNTAVFEYKVLGERHNIDTSHEVAVCEEFQRKAHVWISKAKRERKRPGASY
ncbi:MAG: hypothetical protein PVH45_00060 [Candidatus Omnitrophota bacterium]|jgi:hypothetical protein